MPQRSADSWNEHPEGVFDVTFEGHGWEARGWVPSYFAVEVAVMDGRREVCRGMADKKLDRPPDPAGRSAFHFTVTVPEVGVDHYWVYEVSSGHEVPRRRDRDD